MISFFTTNIRYEKIKIIFILIITYQRNAHYFLDFKPSLKMKDSKLKSGRKPKSVTVIKLYKYGKEVNDFQVKKIVFC